MTVETDPVFEALLAVEGHWRRGELERDDVVALWLDLDHARQILADLLKTLAADAADRLADREDPRADYVTAAGDVVHLAPGYATVRWRGRDVVRRLGRPLLDTSTGEIVDAVDVNVLLDVLPGVADEESTSSKWRTTGLTRHLPDWRRLRSRDDAPLVIRRGGSPT